MNRARDIQIPSIPSVEVWADRRKQFRLVEARAFHLTGWKKNLDEPGYVLEREMERCFCFGAWLACVILGHSMVKSYKSRKGRFKAAHAVNGWMLEYLIPEGAWEKLSDIRNGIVHPKAKSLSEHQYVRDEPRLKGDAQVACLLGLTALFLSGNCKSRAEHEPVLLAFLAKEQGMSA